MTRNNLSDLDYVFDGFLNATANHSSIFSCISAIIRILNKLFTLRVFHILKVSVIVRLIPFPQKEALLF